MINVIGIGQNRENMTLGAIKAIEESDVIIGYKKYINQIEDLIEDKEILKKGMGDEIARAEVAVQKSKEGQTVSLISSGDPGVFGMANVLYQIISKYEGHIPCELVFQGLDCLPEGFTCPEGRTKPWGTNHAVMMGASVINEPFLVINADDFYGRDSFAVIGRELMQTDGEGNYCMVGFRVGNTLSESGTVSRGVCSTNDEDMLTGIVERTDICRIDGKITFTGDNGFKVTTDEQTHVSMNMWGFTPDYFRYSEDYFVEYLRNNISNPKAEFYIPHMVNHLITTGKARVKVLDTTSSWFGVTYAEDRAGVIEKLSALVEAGEYPVRLF